MWCCYIIIHVLNNISCVVISFEYWALWFFSHHIFSCFPFSQEEELRNSGEAKYAHLSNDLHVLIEVFAPPGEAYSRMSHALEEIKKFLVPVSLIFHIFNIIFSFNFYSHAACEHQSSLPNWTRLRQS